MDTITTLDLSATDLPKYQALAEAILARIASGDLQAGQRLPPVRDLAWRIGVTPGTVARAYSVTTQMGATVAVVGSGTFVAAEGLGRNAAPAPASQVAFVHTVPNLQTGPVDLNRLRLPDVGQGAAIAAAMQRAAAIVAPLALDYPSAAGSPQLRAALCAWLGDEMLGPLSPEEMILTSGGQHGLAMVMTAALNGPQRVVLAEELAYPGVRQAARLARAEVVPVALDEQGVIPSVLEALCRRHQPQLLCLTVQGQNPTVARMGLRRRQEIVAIARQFDLQLIEDNCYTLADGTTPSIRALAPERCYHIGSLSKSIAPSLRLGWIVAPEEGIEAIGQVMVHTQFGLSQILVEICRELLVSGAAARLREQVGVQIGARLQMMVNTLGAFDLRWQPGLAFAWLNLPIGWRASSFARAAEAEGVLVRAADEFALVDGRAPNAVRLSLAGSSSTERFEAALHTLVRLLSSPPSGLAA